MTYGDTAKHYRHIAVPGVVVSIVAMERLLLASRLNPKANNASNVWLSRNTQLLLSLPICVVASEYFARNRLKKGVHHQFGSGV